MNFNNEFNHGIVITIVIICLVSLVFGAIVIYRSIQRKPSPAFLVDSILVLGLVCFTYPAFRLLYGLNATATAVNDGAGEMSVTLAWQGIGNALPPITLGLIALHVSVICWFVARRFRSDKTS